MAYRVKINVFDGPFDLLLHLIKINEMDVDDVSVAEIANQYLDYIQLMEELDLEVAGDFLVMAATLINIKARSLLPPREDDEDEEEIDEILSAKELMRQLVEYRKFKEAAGSLKERQERFAEVFYRPRVIPLVPGLEEKEEPLREDLKNLFSAFSRVLRYAEEKGFHSVSADEYSVEEKREYLRDLLLREKSADVTEIFKKCRSKMEMIATFLATLELCRMREVAIQQSGPFQPIYLSLSERNPDDAT